MSHLKQSFSVKFEYQIYFSAGLFQPENRTFADFLNIRQSGASRKIFFVVDEGVAAAHPELINNIKTYFQQHQEVQLVADIMVVPGGEPSKNSTALFDELIAAVNIYGIDRHSFVAAIGGGAVLDLVGYASAVAHRGIRHIRIPTTVLSQNDSGIGVKNGINYKGKKNFLGTFAPPAAVFNDEQFLVTLSDRDWRSGISEAIKVALIKDLPFFEWIEAHTHQLAAREMETMNYLIRRCAQLHLDHIGGDDPFETGSARPLDFGHWSAHKLEQLSNFTILHGEAVAMGIALDSSYSYIKGMLTESQLQRILNVLHALSFDISNPLIQISDSNSAILTGLKEFQEHLGGLLTITLLTDLGTGKEVHEMDEQQLIEASNYVSAFMLEKTGISTINH